LLLLLLLLQVRDNPIWFVAFVWCEVAVQLPFFFIAAYAYLAGERWQSLQQRTQQRLACLQEK
jgi:hypothetical protein